MPGLDGGWDGLIKQSIPGISSWYVVGLSACAGIGTFMCIDRDAAALPTHGVHISALAAEVHLEQHMPAVSVAASTQKAVPCSSWYVMMSG